MDNWLLFGGTFDPVHFGHLKTLEKIQNVLNFKRVIFIPCKSPVLKGHAAASPMQRAEMLRLALDEYPAFELDDREMHRETPSWTVLTLKEFHSEAGNNASLTWLMGEDAFAGITTWYQWEEIFNLAKVLIMKRAGHPKFSFQICKLLNKFEVFTADEFLNASEKSLYRIDAGRFFLSSSEIRRKIQAGDNLENSLPIPVNKYIQSNKLYGR